MSNAVSQEPYLFTDRALPENPPSLNKNLKIVGTTGNGPNRDQYPLRSLPEHAGSLHRHLKIITGSEGRSRRGDVITAENEAEPTFNFQLLTFNKFKFDKKLD